MRKGTAISAMSAVALALLTATAAAPAAAASAPRPVPGPDDVTIEIAAAKGSGCAPGTAKAVIRDDHDGFHLEYSDFTARVGGTSKPADARKNCRLSLKVGAPKGFAYAIAQTDHRLGAQLQRGARAGHKESYSFHGDTSPRVSEFSMTGPRGGSWHFTDRVAVEQLIWKPCDQEPTLDINTELRVEPGTSDPAEVSMISLNSDGLNRAIYHFAWRQCK
ncbi:DUF4360 domain-containing protein [Actinomadura sp. 3N508]|uniref:DUF4360 domain-containing protein n=1 Tax=Actinomadura sp. 3N508 TaxID=3375153 RepID=UPI0037A0E8FC